MDGQESTNDTVLGFCNGASGVRPGEEGLARLAQALDAALLALALSIVADGEGSTRTMRLTVTGAKDETRAQAVARAVANSPLVKTAFYGRDPNWGRIMQAIGQALGRDGHEHLPARISYEDVVIVDKGQPAALDGGPAGPARRDHAPARDRPDGGAERSGRAGDRLLQRPHARLRHPERGVLDMTVRHQKTVKTLLEAMPYIRRFWGATVVLKYGGAAMTSPRLQEQFAEDVVLLRLVGMKPIVVHGGGPAISSHMKRLGMQPEFVDGHRVTNEATMEVAKMVLVGKVNKEIVGLINRHGGSAVGISGQDGRLLKVTPKKHVDAAGNDVDLGFVGEVDEVNTEVRIDLLAEANIPVVATVGADATGEAYNVNADTVAGEVAAAMHAENEILLTDVDGIYEDQGGDVTPYRVRPRLSGRVSQDRRPHRRWRGAQGGRRAQGATRAAWRAPTSSTATSGTRCCLEIMTNAGCGTKVVASTPARASVAAAACIAAFASISLLT